MFITPIPFLLVLFGLYTINTDLQSTLKNNHISKPPSIHYSNVSYPLLTSSINPFISAQAGIIIDDDSKVVLYAKNEKKRFSLASTTKIMTALTALSYFKLDDVLTVKNENISGVTVGFKENEKVTFENLLYGMLLPSGNDAAYAIAQNYPGGEKEFVNKMNENAKKLHLDTTSFVDPAGLNEENYSTASELSRLASYVMHNKTFAGIVGTKQKVITNTDGTRTYNLVNLNRLLGGQGVDGVKTGFTDEAGQVLVTSEKSNGHRYIFVVMKSTDRFSDTEILLSSLENKVTYQQFGFAVNKKSSQVSVSDSK